MRWDGSTALNKNSVLCCCFLHSWCECSKSSLADGIYNYLWRSNVWGSRIFANTHGCRYTLAHENIHNTHVKKKKVCCTESRQKPTGSGISSIRTSNKNAEHNLIHIYSYGEMCRCFSKRLNLGFSPGAWKCILSLTGGIEPHLETKIHILYTWFPSNYVSAKFTFLLGKLWMDMLGVCINSK